MTEFLTTYFYILIPIGSLISTLGYRNRIRLQATKANFVRKILEISHFFTNKVLAC
jgi:hypothetical protein